MMKIAKNPYWEYYRKRWGALVLIFSVAFVTYVFLGLCLSYPVVFTKNDLFFGADSARAFRDLTQIQYDHPRTKVHPLFPLLTETITLLVNGAVNRPTMSVILVESFCGALSLSLFWSILKRKDVGLLVRGIFTFLLGASFSGMIFSTIPETFVFAELGLVGFWYLVTLLANSRSPVSRNEEFLLVCGGVICFGITLTNYVSYLIGLTYLLLSRLDIKGAVKKFLTINTINALITVALCKFQQFVWSWCPLFWTSIVDWLQGAEYEETLYMNWSVNLDKTVIWFKQCILYPLLSAGIYMRKIRKKYFISFSEYPRWASLVLAVFLFIVIVCVFAFLCRMAKGFDFAEHGYMLSLILALIGNLGLHYFYGYGGAFIYSCHYLFLFLLIVAIALDRVESRNVKAGAIVSLLLFSVIMAGNNLWRYFQVAQLALNTVKNSVFLLKAVKGTIACGGLLFLGIIWWLYVSRRKNISLTLDETPKTIIRQFTRVIQVYMVIVFIVGIMISYNW